MENMIETRCYPAIKYSKKDIFALTHQNHTALSTLDVGTNLTIDSVITMPSYSTTGEEVQGMIVNTDKGSFFTKGNAPVRLIMEYLNLMDGESEEEVFPITVTIKKDKSKKGFNFTTFEMV